MKNVGRSMVKLEDIKNLLWGINKIGGIIQTGFSA
jgi:hypothetical protein